MNNYNYIGTKIKQLRLNRKMTQTELCSDLLNRSILSHIENNKMYPSIPQLQYISHKLGVNINYFFDFDDTYPRNSIGNASSIYAELYNEKKYNQLLSLFYKSDKMINELNILECFYISMSFFYTNDFINSLKFLKKFLYLYRKLCIKDQEAFSMLVCIVLNSLFVIMINNKNYNKGLKYLHEAQKYLYVFNIMDSKISYIIHSNIACMYLKECKFSKIISSLNIFLNYNKDHIYINIISNIYLALTIAYYNMGNYTDALDIIKKCKFFYNYTNQSDMALLTNLNIINIYRYEKNFNKAFSLAAYYKIKYSNDECISLRFSIQECVLLFNTQKFDKAAENLDKISFNKLNYSNKKDYFFMKGHIAFIKSSYAKCKSYFNKCKSYYKLNNFNFELSLIYSDLYCITKNNSYLDLYYSLKNMPSRKNILLGWYDLHQKSKE